MRLRYQKLLRVIEHAAELNEWGSALRAADIEAFD
jgi:hypothetical protein